MVATCQKTKLKYCGKALGDLLLDQTEKEYRKMLYTSNRMGRYKFRNIDPSLHAVQHGTVTGVYLFDYYPSGWYNYAYLSICHCIITYWDACSRPQICTQAFWASMLVKQKPLNLAGWQAKFGIQP